MKFILYDAVGTFRSTTFEPHRLPHCRFADRDMFMRFRGGGVGHAVARGWGAILQQGSPTEITDGEDDDDEEAERGETVANVASTDVTGAADLVAELAVPAGESANLGDNAESSAQPSGGANDASVDVDVEAVAVVAVIATEDADEAEGGVEEEEDKGGGSASEGDEDEDRKVEVDEDPEEGGGGPDAVLPALGRLAPP